MTSKKQWIWQDKNYPSFTYNIANLTPIIMQIKYYQGLLDGIQSSINKQDLNIAMLNAMTLEIMDSSAIEGEILNRDSVRSSLAKKLGIALEIHDSSNTKTDGVADILFDAIHNCDTPFTLVRMFGWHNALFPQGYSSVHPINVASFRGEEEMQIISGYHGKEKVHYIAPPRKVLESQMELFLKWLNTENEIPLIKAGIAHLWFVIIHPLDDGNGRIARAITDMILSQKSNTKTKLYSISNAIKNDKRGYYDILESTTASLGCDITPWLEWFLNAMLTSLQNAKENINQVLAKTLFWDKFRDTVFNDRQIKVLNKMLDIGAGNFTGGINTRKYASMTTTSKPTAARELRDLVGKGCLVQIEATAGRNISYQLNIDDKTRAPNA